MKLALSDQQRFALLLHLNGAQVANRIEARKLDKIWNALGLDAVAENIDIGKTTSAHFGKEAREYEIGSSERDALIDYLDRPMTGGFSRLLVAVGNDLLRARDGDGG